MKKFTLLAVFLMLALGALALPAAAQASAPDVTTLAQYFPADAPVYFGFRTDDNFVAQIDQLLAKITSVAAPGQPQMSIPMLLDMAAQQLEPKGTFASTIRSWLGDTAAVGLNELSMQTMQSPVPPITIAIAITDRDKALAFFKTMPNASRYTIRSGNGYTTYAPMGSMSSDPYYIFRDDVVLITGDQSLVERNGAPADSTLAGNAGYTNALAMLPADSYAGLCYLDTPALFDFMMANVPMRSMSDSDRAAMDMVTSMVKALKPQAIGLTMLDSHTLALDIASPVDASALTALSMVESRHPVGPTFAQHLPAGTPFVVQGTNLYESYQNGIANLRNMIKVMPSSSDMRPQDMETALWGLGFLVRGLTGQEVDDALGWMTGDYALTIDLAPAFTDATDLSTMPSSFPLDFGVVIAATDQTAAQATFDGLNRSLLGLPAEDVTVTQETLAGGAPALVFNIHTREMDFPLEILASLGDGVFAIGTRRAVTAAVNPQNGGLTSNATYTEASRTFLSDPNTILYLSGNDLQPIARLLTASGNPQSVRTQGKEIKAVFDLISSISMSVSVQPDSNGSVARLVWTLPE